MFKPYRVLLVVQGPCSVLHNALDFSVDIGYRMLLGKRS